MLIVFVVCLLFLTEYHLANAWGIHLIGQTLDSLTCHGNTSDITPKISSRKHCLLDIVQSIPSLQGISTYGEN